VELTLKSYDAAGNVSSETKEVFNLDRTAPNIPTLTTPGLTLGPAGSSQFTGLVAGNQPIQLTGIGGEVINNIGGKLSAQVYELDANGNLKRQASTVEAQLGDLSLPLLRSSVASVTGPSWTLNLDATTIVNDGVYGLVLFQSDAAGNRSAIDLPTQPITKLKIDRTVSGSVVLDQPAAITAASGLTISGQLPEFGGSYTVTLTQKAKAGSGKADLVKELGSNVDSIGTTSYQLQAIAAGTSAYTFTTSYTNAQLVKAGFVQSADYEESVIARINYKDAAGNTKESITREAVFNTKLNATLSAGFINSISDGYVNAQEATTFAIRGTTALADTNGSATLSLNQRNSFGVLIPVDISGSTGDGKDFKLVSIQNGAFDFQLPASALQDGAYEMSIELSDTAGNRQTFNNRFTLDRTADAAPVAMAFTPASLEPLTSLNVNGAVFTLNGVDADVLSQSNGVTASLSLGTVTRPLVVSPGVASGQVILNIDAADLQALPEGNLTLSVTVRDPAGNTSQITKTIEYDRSVSQPELLKPAALEVINASKSGAVQIEGRGDSGNEVFIQLVDARGNVAAPSAPITVSSDGKFTATVNATALRDGQLRLTLLQKDPVGNLSAPLERQLSLDTVPPSLNLENVSISGATGIKSTVKVGDKLTIAVTINDLPRPQVSVDLSPLFGPGFSNQPLNYNTTSGRFEFTTAAIPAGTTDRSLPLAVTALDTSGNDITVYPEFKVDQAAPSLAGDKIQLNAVASGTNGVLKVGDSLQVSVQAADLPQDVLNGGSVALDLSAFGGPSNVSANFDGSRYVVNYTLAARADQDVIDALAAKPVLVLTDDAGNVSRITSNVGRAVDVSVPLVSLDRKVATVDAGVTLTGTASLADGETLTLVLNSVTYTPSNGLTLNRTAGTWSLSAPVLQPGNYDVVLSAVDNAGNSRVDATARELLVVDDTFKARLKSAGSQHLALASGTGSTAQTILGLAYNATGQVLNLKLNGESDLSADDQQDLASRYGDGLTLASQRITFEANQAGSTDLGLVRFLFSLPVGGDVNSYLKWDPLTQSYREFTYDLVDGTGARLEDLNNDGRMDALAVYVRDGGRGDEDATRNGRVLDPGLLVRSSALTGTSNSDLLQGTTGADVINAGAGNDTLQGNGGADVLIGGIGSDTYVVSDRDTRIVEDVATNGDVNQILSSVSQVLRAGANNITLLGDALNARGNDLNNTIIGNAQVNRLEGMGGDDRLIGQGGDLLLGGDGNDLLFNELAFASTPGAKATLSGDAGNDTLIGGAGDLLSGGTGNDLLVAVKGGATLVGGSGADRFVVAYGERPALRNTVSDFVAGTDKLMLVGIKIPTGATSQRAATLSDVAFTQQYGGTDVSLAGQSVAFLKGVSASGLGTPSSATVELSTTLSEVEALRQQPVL
jgi:Ca2+-binding RTX toxin-like protein